MPETKGKVWGKTTTVCENAFFSVHYLSIKKGGFCSEHKHRQKVNFFYVVRGRLEVTVFDKNFSDKTILTDGQLFSVYPEKYHKFHALEDTECLEIYKPCDLSEDISRRKTGGKAESENV